MIRENLAVGTTYFGAGGHTQETMLGMVSAIVAKLRKDAEGTTARSVTKFRMDKSMACKGRDSRYYQHAATVRRVTEIIKRVCGFSHDRATAWARRAVVK